ncbi:MAG TPA: glucan biosynthesis protein D [Methylomirabilota bacterium]|nr:glucan biosynthesis protein D [Methylomirabilota bacterium]
MTSSQKSATRNFSRRRVLGQGIGLSFATLAGLALGSRTAAAEGLTFGKPHAFDFESLRERAKRLASKPYQLPEVRFGDVLERLDYDAYQQIRFIPSSALWANGDGPFPVQFFHLGRFFKTPVSLHLVKEGEEREILYSRSLFSYGDVGFAADLPDDLGFAGFRVMDVGGKPDWLAFLGAAYFRSSGQLNQYGLSARGIAIDTGLSTPEEFPRFTGFWFEASATDPLALVIYALMDGPSVAGAFRIDCAKHDGTVMQIDAALYARANITRMGVAPLTSMFWYDETNRRQARDWRPEIHDSDGLAIWTGAGERIWRPLNDPPQLRVNWFVDKNPKGFGLLQRDRNFDHYQDDGVFYDRRPSVWVEPLEGWGDGAVQLVEIPTDDEISDNIVAYWLPKTPVKAGSEWNFKYKLHWLADEPYPPNLGRVIASRVGRGGVPGQPRPKGKRKFVIDFAGGPLDDLKKGDPVKLIVDPARGTIDNDYTLQVVGTKWWRAFFDIAVDGPEPVDIRAFLRFNDQALTETWLYQYIPFEY